jgi:hypothetical protein
MSEDSPPLFNDRYVVTGNLSARRIIDGDKSFPICIDWIPADYYYADKKKNLVKNSSLPVLMNTKYNIRFSAKSIDTPHIWRTHTDRIVFKFISNDHKFYFEKTCDLNQPHRFKKKSILNDISPTNPLTSSSNQISIPQIQPQVNVDDDATELGVDEDATELAPDVVIDKKRKRDELILQNDMMDSDIKQLKLLLEDNRQKLVKVQESFKKRLSKCSEIDLHLQKMIEKQSILKKALDEASPI